MQAKTGQTGFEWLNRGSISASTSKSGSWKSAQMELSKGSPLNKSTRSGSQRLMRNNLSTRSSSSVRTRRPSFDTSGSFRPVRSNPFANSRSFSKLENQPEDSPDDSPKCPPCCFNILPSGKHKK